MIQRHIPHAPGTFASCSTCRREPKHIATLGRARDEIITIAQLGERHTLECAICGRSTARHATLDAATAEWGAAHAQGALPLRIVPQRRRSA